MLLEVVEQILGWKLNHDEVRFCDIESFIQVFNFDIFVVGTEENNIFAIMTLNKAHITLSALKKNSFVNLSI